MWRCQKSVPPSPSSSVLTRRSSLSNGQLVQFLYVFKKPPLQRFVQKGFRETDSAAVQHEKIILVHAVVFVLMVNLIAAAVSQSRLRWMLLILGSLGFGLLIDYFIRRTHVLLRYFAVGATCAYPVGAWFINGCKYGLSGTSIHNWSFLAPMVYHLTGGGNMGHYSVFFCTQALTLSLITLDMFTDNLNCPMTQVPDVNRNTEFLAGMADHFIPPVIIFMIALEFIRRLKIQNILLKKATREAERQVVARMEFLSNMSHEIRTPLNGIVSALPLFQHTELSDEQQGCVDIITVSANHLLLLLNDILDVAKLESNNVALEVLPISLEDEADDVVSLLQATAGSKGIDLSVYYSPSNPRLVLGDPLRLKQLLFNLLSNALKFTAKGFVKVEVIPEPDGGKVGECMRRHAGLPDPDDTAPVSPLISAPSLVSFADQPTSKNTGGENVVVLRVSVSDSGLGIPESKRHLLFQRFQQVDGSTTRQYGGTGLGLSIVQDLATLMNGVADVESVEGEGSTFMVTIPFPSPDPVSSPVRGPRTALPSPVHRLGAQSFLGTPLPPPRVHLLLSLPQKERLEVTEVTMQGVLTHGNHAHCNFLPTTMNVVKRYCGDWSFHTTVSHTKAGTRMLPARSDLDGAHRMCVVLPFPLLRKNRDIARQLFQEIDSTLDLLPIRVIALAGDHDAPRRELLQQVDPQHHAYLHIEFLPLRRGDLFTLLHEAPPPHLTKRSGAPYSDSDGRPTTGQSERSDDEERTPRGRLARADSFATAARHLHTLAKVASSDGPKSARGSAATPRVTAEPSTPRTARGKTLLLDVVPESKYLLIAEDNVINQKVLARVLDHEGVHYEMVGTGEQAVKHYQQHHDSIAAILMDLSMPDMDGYEAAAGIRSLERDGGLSKKPIVALTAHAFAEDKEKCIRVGMNDYLTKPYTAKTLIHTLRTHLQPVPVLNLPKLDDDDKLETVEVVLDLTEEISIKPATGGRKARVAW